MTVALTSVDNFCYLYSLYREVICSLLASRLNEMLMYYG
jgi:hypothetical protein